MSTVENIKVVVRVKPLTEEDEASAYENIVDVCEDNQTLILLPNGMPDFRSNSLEHDLIMLN
jgi:hypothetical protein